MPVCRCSRSSSASTSIRADVYADRTAIFREIFNVSAAARNSTQGRSRDTRRQARLAAVQALYQVELGESTPESVVLEFLQYRLEEDFDGLVIGKVDRALFSDLVNSVAARRKDLTKLVQSTLSDGWHVERLETLLRIILLCGAFELSDRTDVPARSVIYEYVELAKAFFNDREPNLVNGVLDKLARTLRPDELAAGGETSDDGAGS